MPAPPSTTLLTLGCIPVINENDTVATAEIRFGDNDRLAARVAEMVQADLLVLLSDIDGLYTADPRHDPNARTSPVVPALTPEIEAMGGDPPPGLLLRWHADETGGGTGRDTGGMRHGHRQGARAAPTARSGGGRAVHVVPARARTDHPRGSAGSPDRWPRKVCSRLTRVPRGRCGTDAHCFRPGCVRLKGRSSAVIPFWCAVRMARRWREACPLTPPRTPRASPDIVPTRSRQFLGGGAAMKSSIGMTWWCSKPENVERE